MNQTQDKTFFINFFIVMVLVVLLIVSCIILGLVFGSNISAERSEAARIAVVKNTEPVGKVRIEGDTTVMSEESMDEDQGGIAMADGDVGESTYNGLCVSCHGSGIPGIPQLGDVANWVPRIAQGNALLYEHAINGYVGESGMPMPAKGGNVSLSDEAVKAAVDYMVANSE